MYMRKRACARRTRFSQFPPTAGILAVLLLVAACGGAGASGGQHAAKPTATSLPTATPIPFKRPDFQAGIAFPRWGTTVYGPTDTDWAAGLPQIRQQTGSRWIEMIINLFQDHYSSTDVHAGPLTTTPQDLASGILAAEGHGFRVFIVPHLLVQYGTVQDDWGGLVSFADRSQASAWFDSYWKALEPYAAVAASTHADQFAIGNEYVGLEPAPDDLWDTLISRVHSVYPGKITYNTNWSSLTQPVRRWMANAQLAAIGVSIYQSLVSRPMALPVPGIEHVWKTTFLPLLDALSMQTKKPVIISEIGYRNATDALYQPWVHTTAAPPDPQLQADAYEGALQSALGDPHVVGTYFYAWGNPPWAPENLPAAQVLHAIYLSPAA
jgi:hypothetical protein